MLNNWFKKPGHKIRLPRPTGMTLVTGAKRELIDAVYDVRTDRMIHLIVHTRQKSLAGQG